MFNSNPFANKTLNVKLTATKFLTDLYNSVDGEMEELLRNQTFLAGGCFASLYHNDKPKDYDIFFRSKTAIDKFKYLLSKGGNTISFNERTNIFDFRKRHAYVSVETDNAISINTNRGVIQFITRFAGTPEEIINGFDFLHTQSFLDIKNDNFKLAEPHIKNKILTYNQEGNDFPLSSLGRIEKFKTRGYSINFKELIKISMTISKLNLLDPKVLHNQLIGYYETEVLDELITSTKQIMSKKFRNKLDNVVND